MSKAVQCSPGEYLSPKGDDAEGKSCGGKTMSGAGRIEWTDYHPHTRKPVYVSAGYVWVWCPEHPNSNLGKAGHRGYIQEHRLVMSNFINRPLEPNEHVHHINGNKADNRIENLQMLSNSEHRILHESKITKEQKKKRAAGLVRYAKSRRLERKETLCACGCGQVFITPDPKGRYHKYIHGHNQTGKSWKWRKDEHQNRVC